MTLVVRYRISYLLLFVFLASGTHLTIRAMDNDRIAFAVAIVLLLIPGRVQGLLSRLLFRGQRDLTRGNAGDATREFETFIGLLESQPWRRWALWLGWSLYTPSATALGLNNLGVAHAHLGKESSAREDWERALAIDPLYLVPYAELATSAAAGGNAEQATNLLAQAKKLGYMGGALDQATHRVQQLLAAVESRGPSL